MNTLRNEVRLAGADLCVGETIRVLCPECRGGSDHELSLSVTRDDEGLLYNCYRATCPTAGRASGRSLNPSTRKVSEPTHYEGGLHPLGEDWWQYLADEVGFDDEHIHRSKARIADDGRVAYPVLGPQGRRRGLVLRSYTGQKPKALTYMDVADEPKCSWYPWDRWERGAVVWVVEDIPSAIRASRYVDAIALCGSGASQDAIDEISAHYECVVWALDADATVTALEQQRRWGLYFSNSRVQVLEQDLKDMNEEDLCKLLT